MADHIAIRNAPGIWVVRAGGAVLGESRAALELTEGSRLPVIYFPRGDIAMALLEKSVKVTTCPRKGEASYYSIVTESTTYTDAAWSYEAPIEAAARIKGYLAFYPDKATVERI